MSELIKTKMYIHRSKESNYDVIHDESIEMSETAKNRFLYTMYEIAVDVEIDMETGTVWATHFAGKELSEKVEV